MHRLTTWGQWAVQLLQCTASLPGGSGPCSCCYALPNCLGAVGRGNPAMHCHTAWGHSGQWNSYNAPPHPMGALGSATPAKQGVTAWGQWVVQLLQSTMGHWAWEVLQCTAALLG